MTDLKRGSGTRSRKAKTRMPAYTIWSRKFLAHLAATSNVSASAEEAGVSSTTVYDTRRSRPEFNRRWREALLEGYEHLEMELLHRLRSGEVKPPAAEKGTIPSFDNGTTFRLLSLHRETIAKQRALQDDEDEEEILASINAKLELMRQRDLEALARGETEAKDVDGDR